MSVWAEAWSRPGDPNFGRLIDDLPFTSYGLHDGVNQLGDGNGLLPDTFDRFDEILLINQTTPANSVRSLIRYFDDSDPTTPFFEWLPGIIHPVESKESRTSQVSGPGIKSIWGHARLEPFDWDGSDDFVPTFPDWVYGGPNLLVNPGFEDNDTTPSIYELWTDATGGTFTLSDGTNTTAVISFNASPTTVEVRLEADIAAISDVLVTGVGTEADPYRIEFVTPALDITLTCNGAGLIGATAGCVLTETQVGLLDPRPWTKSRQISFGVPKTFGTYASDGFRLTEGAEPVLSGSHALRVNGLSQFAGAQQVIRVKEGGTYQVKVPVWTSSATDIFRVVIRQINGKFIASSTPFSGSTTASPSAWDQTTFVITDLVIPDGVTEVIVRFAYVGTGNPSPFYLDDIEFTEGLSAATLGKILGDIYDHAVDPALRSPIVWDDGSATNTPYLTLDFTDVLDSGGQAWVDPAVSVKLWMRMRYDQIIDQFVRSAGYEWRIVPNNVETGTWKLQVYNPGTMKVDHTSAASPAIQGGSSDVRRRIRRLLPEATDFLVEGLERITSRDRNPDLIDALGRVEVGRLDKELPSAEAVVAAAFEDSTEALPASTSLAYNLVAPQDIPLVDYALGDLIIVHDPPEFDGDARFADVVGSFTPDSEEWAVDFVPASVVGS